MTHFIQHYGALVVFAVVFIEIFGLPFVPGEAALITGSVLAQRGHLSLAAVMIAGVAAAITGAAAGYAVGRWRGRDLLRWGFLARITERPLQNAERFFERHGAKAVFLGRFAPLLRAVIGWTAGVSGMPWRRFLVWNVVGGVVWGIGVSLAAFYVGKAFVDAINRYGAIGGGVVAAAILLVFLATHLWRRRAESA